MRKNVYLFHKAKALNIVLHIALKNILVWFCNILWLFKHVALLNWNVLWTQFDQGSHLCVTELGINNFSSFSY